MTLTIVTSHWNEDLDWLKKSKFPVVLIDKVGAAPSWLEPKHIVEQNKGKEVSAYLKYIIENYDNLPDHVAFIHGHEKAIHQLYSRPLLEVIEHANIEKYDYISLNNIVRFYTFANEPIKDFMQIEDMWSEWFPWGAPARGAQIVYPVSAQFIVSKKAILKHPKNLYENWYSKIMEFYWPLDHSYTPPSCPLTFFECLWHVIFGEPLACRVQRDWFSFPTEPVRIWSPNCYTTDEPIYVNI